MEENEPDFTLPEKIKKYITLRIDIAYLSAVDKGSTMMASAISGLILIAFSSMFLLFGSLALGYYLSQLFGSFFYGFGFIALFYLFVTLIVLLIRKPMIEKPLTDKFVRELCKDIELEDDGK